MGEEYRPLSSSLCSFLYFPVTSSVVQTEDMYSTTQSLAFVTFVVLYKSTRGTYMLSSGAFAKLRKATNTHAMSACPSVRPYVLMEQFGSRRTDFHENQY